MLFNNLQITHHLIAYLQFRLQQRELQSLLIIKVELIITTKMIS